MTKSMRQLRWWQIAAVALVVLFGLGLRLYGLGRGLVNSDEAVVGLMAHAILHGHFSAFFWGQNYGGSEAYVVAGFFAIFGQSPFVLGLVPMVLGGIAAVLLWRVGRRLFSDRTGVLAALAFWVWPAVYVHQSTVEDGFRWLAVALGLSLLLLVLRITQSERPTSKAPSLNWILLGLVVGVGWWTTPEIAYYALPSGLFLMISLLRRTTMLRMRDVVAGALCAGVGALPWLYVNAGDNFFSLTTSPQPYPGFSVHLHIFWDHVLPIVLGLERTPSGNYVLGRLGETMFFIAVVVGVAWLIKLATKQQALLLVFCVVVFPLSYVLSPFSWFWNDGRYAVHYAVFLSLLFSSFAVSSFDYLKDRARSTPLSLVRLFVSPVVVIGACIALTIEDASQMVPYETLAVAGSSRSAVSTWHTNPNLQVEGLAAGLQSAHITAVFAGYWLAYPIVFESHGAIAATPVGGSVRSSGLRSEVVNAPVAGWVFSSSAERANAIALNDGDVVDPVCSGVGQPCLHSNQLERYLRRNNIAWHQYLFGNFVVVVPKRRIDPGAMLLSLGFSSAVASSL